MDIARNRPEKEGGGSRWGSANWMGIILTICLGLPPLIVMVWGAIPATGLVLLSTLPSATTTAAVSGDAATAGEHYAFTFVLENKGKQAFSQPIELKCRACSSIAARQMPSFDARRIEVTPLGIDSWSLRGFSLSSKGRALLEVEVTSKWYPDLDIAAPDVYPPVTQDKINAAMAVLIVMLIAVDLALTYRWFRNLRNDHSQLNKTTGDTVNRLDRHCEDTARHIEELRQKQEHLDQSVIRLTEKHSEVSSAVNALDKKHEEVGRAVSVLDYRIRDLGESIRDQEAKLDRFRENGIVNLGLMRSSPEPKKHVLPSRMFELARAGNNRHRQMNISLDS